MPEHGLPGSKKASKAGLSFPKYPKFPIFRLKGTVIENAVARTCRLIARSIADIFLGPRLGSKVLARTSSTCLKTMCRAEGV